MVKICIEFFAKLLKKGRMVRNISENGSTESSMALVYMNIRMDSVEKESGKMAKE